MVALASYESLYQPNPAVMGFKGPLRHIPDYMRSAFTMDGSIPVIDHFFAEAAGGEIHWSNDLYTHRLTQAALVANGGKSFGYDSDPHLVKMIEAHPIKDMRVLVIGSGQPTYEAFVEHFGGSPSTVEYRKIHHTIPGLKTFTVSEMDEQDLTFDAAVSISSIEHDGLGRYGDPIDPDGDLKAMQKARDYLKPGGKLFLAVPIGPDCLAWNAHRIYGELRLPRLLEGWKQIDRSGFTSDLFASHRLGEITQPVLVLERV